MTGVWLSSPSCPPSPLCYFPAILSVFSVSPLLVTLLTLKWKLSFFPTFVSGGSSWGTPRTDLGRGIDKEGARDLHLQLLTALDEGRVVCLAPWRPVS